jgi:hypothetical protein
LEKRNVGKVSPNHCTSYIGETYVVNVAWEVVFKGIHIKTELVETNMI